MRGLHQLQDFLAALVFDGLRHREEVAVHGLLLREFNHSIGEPLLRRKLSLQFLLPPDGSHRVVHAKHLVIARQDLARCSRLAGVEQDEVLHEVEQPVMGEHAIEQHLCFDTALVALGPGASIRRNVPTDW